MGLGSKLKTFYAAIIDEIVLVVLVFADLVAMLLFEHSKLKLSRVMVKSFNNSI